MLVSKTLQLHLNLCTAIFIWLSLLGLHLTTLAGWHLVAGIQTKTGMSHMHGDERWGCTCNCSINVAVMTTTTSVHDQSGTAATVVSAFTADPVEFDSEDFDKPNQLDLPSIHSSDYEDSTEYTVDILYRRWLQHDDDDDFDWGSCEDDTDESTDNTKIDDAARNDSVFLRD